MQAVILAAGEGTRLRPLTYKTPKPLLKINGKCLMEYNIDQLPKEIDELVIVIGYKGDKIRKYFGNNYKGRKVIYVEQNDFLGTGHAVKACQGVLDKRFLVLMGDDIYSREDMKKMLQHNCAMLVKEVKGKFTGGRIVVDKDGCLEQIVEGQHESKVNYLNTAMYVLTDDYFKYPLVSINKKEYGLPQTMVQMIKDVPIKIVKASKWIQITDLNDYNKAKKLLA